MTKDQRQQQQQRTYFLAIGIQIHAYGKTLPKSIYRALDKRGKELGIDLAKDIEHPPICR